MTTPAVNSYNKYQGNGSTTEFSINFPYLSQSYVKVYVKRKGMEEELMDSSDYSFVNSTTLKFPSTTSSETVLATGDVITIQRETPLANQYEFSNQKRLFPEDVMGADDLDMQILQEQGRELSRAVKVSPTSSVEPEELIKEVEAIYDAVDAIEEIVPDLPNINTVANNISDVNTVAGSIGDINDVADNLSNITAVKNNATNINAVAGNATNINTVAGKTSEITTVAGISSEVATVAGISANVTSVAGNATNINAVAGNATNINAVNANKTNIDTVASNSTNINTVAGISSDVTTTAGLASDIAVVVSLKDDIPVVVQAAEDIDKVEDIAADITTVAGISSDVSTVATISSSVSTVSSNISNVNSVAGNASNINSVASNSSNINSVATNISNVNTVATNASSISTCASNISAINDAPNQAAAAAASAELSAQYANDKINQTHISNCLTETSTDVNVTVSNYNPVIKAGSIAYFPNGFASDGTTKKFSSLEIASDTSCSQTSQSGTVRLLCVDTDGNSYGALKGGYDVTSLPGSPTNYYLYYHTGENKIYLYNGSAWKQVSFPFAMYVEAQSNVNPDIKEIYNTIGIMNDWVFARPGIKGLIPNGRNADGTLNNESFETKNVLMKKPTTVRDVYLSSSEIYFYSGNVYDEKTNYNSIGQYCFVGTVFANTNLNSVSAPKTCDYSASKQSFKAVDSNDIENIEQNFLSENGDSYFLNKAEKPGISVLSDGRISCKRFKYYVPTLQGYRERYFREYTTNSAPSCEAGRDAFVFINQSGTLSFLSCYRCYTGSSQPVSPYTYALWYNGATISFTSNAGSTWTPNNSIPLAVLEVDSNGTPKRVKHLFSDVAFFGNVVFQKNFVKYKNSWRTGINAVFYSDGDYVIDTMQFGANHYFEQDEQPTVNNCIWKQISTDKIFYKNSSGNISETDTMVMGKVSVRSGLVTSFTPRDKFVIADRNNILSLIATGNDYIGSRQFGAIIEEGTYYLMFSSGKMIQFGITDSINAGSVSQVSLPKPFASTDYYVTGLTQSGHSGSISSYSASHGVAGNYSTTQFDVKNCGSYSAAYDWIAIGHWK